MPGRERHRKRISWILGITASVDSLRSPTTLLRFTAFYSGQEHEPTGRVSASSLSEIPVSMKFVVSHIREQAPITEAF